MTRPAIRRLLRIALIVGVVGSALLATLVAQRRPIARAVVDAQLRNLGLEEFRHEVERFGPNEFGLRDVQVGNAERGLEIARISARYSVSSLLTRRLDRLDIRGVRLRGTVDDGRISFGALDTVFSKGPSDAAAPSRDTARAPSPLVARAVAIDDAEIELTTPDGPIVGRFDARIGETDGRLHGSGSASGRHPEARGTIAFEFEGTPDRYTGSAQFELEFLRSANADGGVHASPADAAELESSARLSGNRERVDITVEAIPFRIRSQASAALQDASGEAPALTLSLPLPVASAPLTIASSAAGGHLRLPGLGLELTGFSVAAELAPGTLLPAGELRVERVADLRSPERFAASALTSRVAFGDSSLDFDARLQPPDGAFELRMQGSHALEGASGSARLQLAPIEFADGGLQPAAVFPSLGSAVSAVTGTVSASGSARWSRDAPLRMHADVIARELSFDSEFGRFERLDTAIRVEGPTPAWRTPPGQLLSMASVDFGLALTNGLVSLRWLGGERFEIGSAEFSLAGGTIHTQGSIDLSAPRQAVLLELRDLELARLLELVDLDGLSGSGRLAGRVPLVRTGASLEIEGGKLEGVGPPGWIKYRSGIAGAEREGLGVALEALENFQYDAITATLDGDTEGPVMVSIRLEGRNPDYLEGHPIDFTLNVESHLVDLLRKASSVYRIPEQIQKRIEALSGASD